MFFFCWQVFGYYCARSSGIPLDAALRSTGRMSADAFRAIAHDLGIVPTLLSAAELEQVSAFRCALPPFLLLVCSVASFSVEVLTLVCDTAQIAHDVLGEQVLQDDGFALSYPQFVDVLCRAAVSVFSRYPFDAVPTSARDKVEALLQRMDMSKGASPPCFSPASPSFFFSFPRICSLSPSCVCG